MTHAQMHICDQIRQERRWGSTRCGVIVGLLNIGDVARAFGLASDSSIYRSITRTEAETIAAYILQADLAHGSEIMSATRAAELWQQFMALFEGQDVEFATNAAGHLGSWTPATGSIFDMGVLLIGSASAGCLWVEDED